MSNTILSVETYHGDPPPSFSCLVQADVPITYIASWAINESSDIYSVTSNAQGTLLTWLRPLDLSDTGQYLCNITVAGQGGVQSARVNLEVRRKFTL